MNHLGVLIIGTWGATALHGLPPGLHAGMKDRYGGTGPVFFGMGIIVKVHQIWMNGVVYTGQPFLGAFKLFPRVVHPVQLIVTLVQGEVSNARCFLFLILTGPATHSRQVYFHIVFSKGFA